MAPPEARDTAILYQNAARTVTLFDIPRSIALAQCLPETSNTSSCSSFSDPLSTKPQESPFPSTEPGFGKRNLFPQSHRLSFPVEVLTEGLRIVNDEVGTNGWCLPRQLWSNEALEKKTEGDRKLSEMIDDYSGWSLDEPVLLTEGETEVLAMKIRNRLICNKHLSVVRLKCMSVSMTAEVPPLARFLLSNINPNTTMSFSMAALHEYPSPSSTSSAGAGEFDVIVIDPPWPNRSVRRSQKYQTMEG